MTPVDMKAPIRFKCTGCGACCKAFGKVVMRIEEAELAQQIANLHNIHLNFTTNEATPWATRLEAPAGCPLLGEDNKCLMGDSRPETCRAFPFWPHLMANREAFETAKDLCEGIDHPEGEAYSAKRVLRILRHVEGT